MNRRLARIAMAATLMASAWLAGCAGLNGPRNVSLSQVRVQEARLDLGNGPLSPSGARVGALLAERLLDDFVLYRAEPQRLELLQRAGATTAEIVVTPRGVDVRFGAPK